MIIASTNIVLYIKQYNLGRFLQQLTLFNTIISQRATQELTGKQYGAYMSSDKQ